MSSFSSYTINAEQVLGAALQQDRKRAIHALIETYVKEDDFRDTYREIYRISLDIIRRDEASYPTPAEVYALSNKTIPFELLTQLAEGAAGLDKQSVQQSADLVIEFARRMRLIESSEQFRKNASDIQKDISQAVSKHVREISHVHTRKQKPADAKSIADNIVQNGTYIPPIPTGNSWIDYVLKGGVRPKRHIVIAGPEKQRKTTLARNILLGLMTRQKGKEIQINHDVEVIFLAFENDREITFMDFAAMLAYQHLLMDNSPNVLRMKVNDRRYAHEFIDSEEIYEAISPSPDEKKPRKINSWVPDLRQAVTKAIQTASLLPLYIYDAGQETGNLSTLSDIDIVLHKHEVLRGDRQVTPVIVTDYVGLVRVEGESNTYAAQTEITRYLHNKMTSYGPNGAAMITIGQYNSKQKYDIAGDTELDVIGIDNNPDLARVAHHVFDVLYPDSQQLTVRHRRGRRTAGGMKNKKDFHIHPASGMIIGAYNEQDLLP